MDFQLTARVVRSEAITFTELDDTVVMMDVGEGLYYELDPVGVSIWALLGRARSAEEVCEALGRLGELRRTGKADEARA